MLADVLFMGYGTFGGTALHLSASSGHDLIAAQLLAENPDLIHVQNKSGSLALHFAAQAGHNEIVAMLIAKAPHLTTAENDAGDTAFHVAASSGHGTVLAQLLAANSGLANVGINQRCWNVLHCAVSSGEEAVVEMVLAVDPTLIHAASEGNTVLHLAVLFGHWSKPFFARLLALEDRLLHMTNSNLESPFEIALMRGNESAIEALQWKMTIDELMRACWKVQEKDFKERRNTPYEEQLRLLVAEQCECLLGKDVF